jgi:AraC-like DNA-binding protein
VENAIIQFHPIVPDSDVRFVRGQNVGAHTFPCHAHRSFSLGLVGKGQRIIQVNGESFHISAGEGFILNPQQPHVCSVIGPEGHDYWVISIHPARMQTLFHEATGLPGFPHFSQVKITNSSFLDDLAAWLENQPAANEHGFIDLLHTLLVCCAEEITPNKPAYADILASTFRQLENRQSEAVSLHELAETAHISPFYLNRIFRQVVGVPPHTYLLQSRIKKSLELLLKTGSIAASAQRLGFADQSHFTRLFKREVGITPGRFIDLHNKENN